jgi:hypothetical protein
MAKRTEFVRMTLILTVLAGLLLGATGCGYVKNVRDDVLDLGTMAVGGVTPVAPTKEGPEAVGIIPPTFGVYLEATEFMHLGYLFKATGDLEWDRRGYGFTVDVRHKYGIGPFHHVAIRQYPVCVNEYKRLNNGLDGWREHMDDLSDPLWGRPGKVLVFGRTVGVEDEEADTIDSQQRTYEDYVAMMENDRAPDQDEGGLLPNVPTLPWLHRGWQDWEMISLEVAVPAPFCLHSGFYARVGVDPSQVFDLALGLVAIDLYSDSAYKFWSGDYKHLTEEQVAEREAQRQAAAQEAEAAAEEAEEAEADEQQPEQPEAQPEETDQMEEQPQQ